jgi:hypothetical protein
MELDEHFTVLSTHARCSAPRTGQAFNDNVTLTIVLVLLAADLLLLPLLALCMLHTKERYLQR